MRWNKIRRRARGGVNSDSPIQVGDHELRTVRPGSLRSGRSIKTVLPSYDRGQAPPEYSVGTSATDGG